DPPGIGSPRRTSAQPVPGLLYHPPNGGDGVRLRDVLARPGLGLELLVGADKDLDRPVGRVYVTDLLDPSRYLSGGEFVLTGLMWRAGPAGSEIFAAPLARAGVTAVGAGEAAFGSVPADLVTACRRHDLPLVRVPVDVSFQV